MKKILLALLFVFCVTGCTNRIEKFCLSDEFYTLENRGLKTIQSYNEIAISIENQKSFAVYVFLEGCTTCAQFRPILSDYLDKNNLMFYAISYNVIQNVKEENDIEKHVKYAPSVVLFKEGMYVTCLDATKDAHTSYYKTIEGFSNWFTTYVEI